MDSCLRIRVCNGFSLIELLVTISILAVLLSIGLPSLVTFINNNRITTQAYDIVVQASTASSLHSEQRPKTCRLVMGFWRSPTPSPRLGTAITMGPLVLARLAGLNTSRAFSQVAKQSAQIVCRPPSRAQLFVAHGSWKRRESIYPKLRTNVYGP